MSAGLQTDEYPVTADPGMLLLLIWHQHQAVTKDLLRECLATNTCGVEIFQVFKTFMNLRLSPKTSVLTAALTAQSSVDENGRHRSTNEMRGTKRFSNLPSLSHTLKERK